MGSRLEANATAVRKRIEAHKFDDEGGDEYEGSKFGGFPEYFRRKKIKLQNLDANLRAESADKPQIFRGIVAHVNGYTQPSLNDLHKMIVSHGGGFMQYLDGKTTVTHIIASNLTPRKAVEFKRYRIVKPAWIVDSVAAGKVLPWDAYRVVDEGVGQKLLGFDNGKVVSQVNQQVRGYKEQTENSWYTKALQTTGEASEAEAAEASTDVQVNPPTPDPEDGAYEDGYVAEPTASDEGPAMPAEARTSLGTPPKTSPELNDGQQEHNNDMSEEVAAKPDISEREDRSSKRSASGQSTPPPKRSRLSAEEHNAILLADPNIRKSTVVNPEFLEQYYRESRLHHLSTWKADLKAQLQAQAAEQSATQKARQKRLPGSRRYILHVDFDSFFVAVSLKKNPEFKDKPAVVAHGGGSGSEIASCNYPARKFGVKNGMWMKRAQEMCPDLKVLPYDFPGYEEASRAFYDSIIATGGIVQSVSIDEALVDVSTACFNFAGTDGVKRNEGGQYREQAKADEIAKNLRDDVRRKTGCEVSVGIGGNILLAKVALRKAKPAGQRQITPDDALEVLGTLEVQDLPGVAYSIGGKLEDVGIKFVHDIRDFSREKLINTLGPKTGEKIWDYARGIDRTEVGDQVIRKSVSAEVNWGVRFENQEQVDEFIENLCGELQRRLLKEGVKGRQLTLKIMRKSPDAPLDPPKHLGHGKCDTHNRSIALGVATNAKEILTRETLSILKAFGFGPGELRGIGVQMTKLEPMKSRADGQLESSQRRLFFKPDDRSNTEEKLIHQVVAKPTEDPIEEAKTPKKDRQVSPPISAPTTERVDEITTPEKDKGDSANAAFGAETLNVSTPSRRSLNTGGTQFFAPTQIDQQVLAELPEDIRARLTRHIHNTAEEYAAHSFEEHHMSAGSVVAPSFGAVPTPSRIDAETLSALPPDLQDEVLNFYSASSRARRAEQQLLPQSPRKARSFAPARAPLKRGRGRPSKTSLLSSPSRRSTSTLTQSNFVATRQARSVVNSANTTPEPEEPKNADLDAEFLAALPEDIRQEVLAEQRRTKLRKHGGLEYRQPRLPAQRHVKSEAEITTEGSEDEERELRTLELPPHPPKPSFTTRKLQNAAQLREAINSWWSEFRNEGPYHEDLTALTVYLERVIHDERDLHKAIGMVKWLAYVVQEGLAEGFEGSDSTFSDKVRQAWIDALETIQDAVQAAVKARGLGRVDFE